MLKLKWIFVESVLMRNLMQRDADTKGYFMLLAICQLTGNTFELS